MDDSMYYRQRLAEERALARTSGNRISAAVHEELATRFEDLAKQADAGTLLTKPDRTVQNVGDHLWHSDWKS